MKIKRKNLSLYSAFFGSLGFIPLIAEMKLNDYTLFSALIGVWWLIIWLIIWVISVKSQKNGTTSKEN